ncbi:MerR family transcriptional regulator [Streptomyces boncukensis]|uniref:MerR family transcriptional regulator n=1 Tax=Streptomyces boncukensis TaxID=2711219 RepID=A0A6G4X7E4_9ACTN|nr:MerR family transcriptional regulator [Streptomyces boncukensis]NGO73308.1 MerR family transcriptional regulator [Streptomyces boncukensis]
MRIGDAATALGTTPRALRYYEQRGLLRAARAPSGHREYGAADLERLRTVRLLLESGLTIENVRDILDLPDTPPPLPDDPENCPARDVVLRRIAELDRGIARLMELRARLAERCEDRFAGILPFESARPADREPACMNK